MQLLDISCTNCGRSYPLEGLPYHCQVCGGVYDSPAPLNYDPNKVDKSENGIWRHRHTFGFPAGVKSISLGEGNTPLIWTEALGRQVAFKCEYLNPTGSFKDRGSSLIAAALRSRGFNEALEDSSGNAGASFAAYAAKAGIKAKIFVPEYASGPKCHQIKAYGAEIISIPGLRSDVSDAIRAEADNGHAYGSHAYLPFNIPGYATLAYEIYDQVGCTPGAVIVPVGQGGLLLGLYRGFDALRLKGLSYSVPAMIGVQAEACAPLWTMFTVGSTGLDFVAEGQTLAEGVRVRYPIRGDAILRAVKVSGGNFSAVKEQDILRGRDKLALKGLFVEPTSALVWAALEQNLDRLTDPIVVILTGSGYKVET